MPASASPPAVARAERAERPVPVEPPSVDAGTAVDDAGEADALPAVGRVFEGEKRSLGGTFAPNRGSKGTATPPLPTAENVEPVPDGEFATVMRQLRTAMTQHGSGYEGILVHGQIVSLGNGQATIRYSHQHEASARMLERNGKREAVQKVLSELVNEPLGLTIEVEAEMEAESAPMPQSRSQPARAEPRHASRAISDAAPASPAPPRLSQEQKQKILANDPLVRAAVELFGGEIVKADDTSQ